MSKKLISIAQKFKYYIVLFITITGIWGTIYAVLQQNYRQNANDPQIQLAEDGRTKLLNGVSAMSVVDGYETIDISNSLYSFVVVYDNSGKAVGSSGLLRNQIPTPPSGVFSYANDKNEDRFTWEPEKNVRIAAVMLRVNGQFQGYVLAGRSLREVESRVTQLTQMMFLGWAITVVLSLAVVIFLERNPKIIKTENPETKKE